MADKPTSANNINTNECNYKYQFLGTNEYGYYAESESGVCIRLYRDVSLKGCYYRQLKQAEQNAQDTYDMFKACMQSLEIARKQLSDEQQKVYQIGKICEEWRINDSTNTSVQLMVNKITDIIGDKTNATK